MPVRPSFNTAHDIAGKTLPDGRFILAVMGFGADRPPALASDIPFTKIAMPGLGSGPCYEVWSSNHQVNLQTGGPLPYATAGNMLLGIVPLAESHGDLRDLAYDTYCRIFQLADAAGFPHLIRVFNYLPDITGQSGGTERYRQFNAGRHRAFEAHRRPLTAAPAACALGTRQGNPVVYFLASGTEGAAIENPRQLSAYHYPAQYGPVSPSFSRAMTIGHENGRDLYISGTASIVGHRSLHPGDPAAQTAETLRNIQALLAQCGIIAPPGLTAKIYVRHAGDFDAVNNILQRSYPDLAAMFLQADICRPELLVEIEAFCRLPT